MQKKKLYVGCAVHNAPKDFSENVENLKSTLEDDFEVLRFLGSFEGTADDVFKHDIDCVRSCDIFLAICDIPSTGLGFEIASALAWGKRVIGVAQRESSVSRMVIGIDDPNFTFVRYTSFDDIRSLLK
ncbi:MAG: hypothetical protein KBD16_00955 [Candidatus Pacebacteria bacterium]|nr:hypothetical protein [Candidatus Paceibacterota bacterium]